MLEFFRKYQRLFFIFITVIIVISFSFFGTYNTLPQDNYHDIPAFQAVDGSIVSRHELDKMLVFLSSDIDDKVYYGGAWGPNFLNNGALNKWLLQTGIAQQLVQQYSQELAPDLEKRLAFEKRYNLYSHPQAKFISTENAWSNYAPSLLTDFKTLQKAETATDSATFAARINLYLAEKNFSSPKLQRLLMHQEQQFPWITPDENLRRTDLSLFGYHNLNDWFGPRFMNLATEFIYNSAKIAEQRGYRVSKADALADLMNNAAVSFQQNLKSRELGVANTQEYFNEQLRRMGIDQNGAIKIWQNVLLARRLFEEAGNSVFTTPQILADYISFAKEPAEGEIYQLPKELKLGDFSSLQKFELYLDAVSNRTKEDKANLTLPNNYLSPKQVAQRYPELVRKSYQLEIVSVNKEALLNKIPSKEILNWELDDANWKLLQNNFPDIGILDATTKQERLSVLNSLNEKSHAEINQFAGDKIFEARPELVTKALKTQTPVVTIVDLPLKGSADKPLEGIKNADKLIVLLDKAPIDQTNVSPEQVAITEQLAGYTQDQKNFYHITVIERTPNEEILTFAQANQKGVLDLLLTKALEVHYEKIREGNPKEFQREDKSWKDISEVKGKIGESYFAELLKAVQAQEKSGSKLTGDQAASKRLMPYVKNIKQLLEVAPDQGTLFVKEENKPSQDMAQVDPLKQQWQLEKRHFRLDRSQQDRQVNTVDVLDMPENAWSTITQTPTGAIFFYQKLPGSQGESLKLAEDKSSQVQHLLASEIQQLLAEQLITDFKAKKAISLEFLNVNGEESIN